MTKELTCIICPKGCRIKVEYEGNNIISVTGNSCKRGYAYACDEAIDPKRTVTSTMRTVSGKLLPVKTDKPIQKKLIFECMKAINTSKADDDTKIGDIILSGVLGTDVNIVATGPVR
ncbi:MAG: DUF1667 domain-containing protein [Clostridiales bacterium]|nr:DUF1667 domain-containing protein [Clostridiales bacterium]